MISFLDLQKLIIEIERKVGAGCKVNISVTSDVVGVIFTWYDEMRGLAYTYSHITTMQDVSSVSFNLDMLIDSWTGKAIREHKLATVGEE